MKYNKENTPVGSEFIAFCDTNIVGTVTNHWFDHGDGLTIKWSNGNVSKLYWEELKNQKIRAIRLKSGTVLAKILVD